MPNTPNSFPILSGLLSDTVKLNNISVSPGTLTPYFNQNITNYTVEVENNVTQITISAVPSNINATVIGAGTIGLNVGANTIQITVIINCNVNIYTIVVTRKAPTAVDNIYTKNVKLYPNPVKNELYIENLESSGCQFIIYSVSGKQIVNGKLLNGKSINVAHLLSGVYFIKIQTDNGVITRKFVKE